MMSRLFYAYGHMCASRPWEMIFGAITMTVCTVSMFATSHKICGFNYKCTQQDVEPPDMKSSHMIILTIIRCMAVVYIYLQFTNLRKLGSKYLLGIAGLFTVFSSFMFSIAVINILGDNLTGLNEALPCFLLLVDLSRAGTLARFALSSKCQNEIGHNIAKGMAIIGPGMTLDAIVEILVIGVGTLSGVKQLETMCCFGCLSMMANYVTFMTFFPACLALVLELSRGNQNGVPVWQLKHVSKMLQDKGEVELNPVTQRVKVIMSAGLFMVHVHNRWESGFIAMGSSVATLDGDGELTRYMVPDCALWEFLLKKTFQPRIDYLITAGLALILGIKYVLYDPKVNIPCSLSQESSEPPAEEGNTEDGLDSTDKTTPMENGIKPYDQATAAKASFIIGDFESVNDNQTTDVATQTEFSKSPSLSSADNIIQSSKCQTRTLDQCLNVMKSEEGVAVLTDAEVLMLVKTKHLPAYKLEAMLQNCERGVSVRRQLIGENLATKDALENLPYSNYNYKYVQGVCCENVLGYMPVPVGVAGPLLMNNKTYHIPLATTEGCLVASTNRGCRAITLSGGAKTYKIGGGMTRAPVVQFPSAGEAASCKQWLEDIDNFDFIVESFNSTTRYGQLKSLHVCQAAKNLYIRFVANTADAMGMNILSKGSEKVLDDIQQHFPNMKILALSGNFCTDKKSSAVNWIEGRGKSVVCEAVIPVDVVRSVLKTSVGDLIELNISKNFMGSAMAGSIGGFNAHAANVVTAMFIATGQDPAQNVVSSNCMTVMEKGGLNSDDLYISCTMPSIEVGTVGGGTTLPPQAACLQMLGLKGSQEGAPGRNADVLAMVVCTAVMAGELSLMSALAAGQLVKSHLKHNRSAVNIGSPNTCSI